MVEVRNFIKGKAQKVVSTTESAYRKVEWYVDNKIQERERNSLDRDLRNEKNNLIGRVSGVLDDYRKEISGYRLQLKSTQAQENPNIKMGVYRTIEIRTKDLPSHLTQAVNKCGYSNMKAFKQHLKQNWRSLTKENIAQYLNNMKNPPFPYYYNAKKARTLCKTWKIKGDIVKYYNPIIEKLKMDDEWCSKALTDNMIINKVFSMMSYLNIENQKNQENQESKQIEKTNEELHDLIIQELNNCSENNFDDFLDNKLREIIEKNLVICKDIMI